MRVTLRSILGSPPAIVHYGGSKGMGKEGSSSAKELQKVPKGEDESSIPRYFKASGKARKGLKPKGGER